jgi:hypothetical protein
MDYTLKTLKDLLRKRLQDEDFDGDTLTHFLNQSQSEILGEDKYPFMQRIDQYTADEKGEISLPPFYAGTFYIYAKKEHEPRQELNYLAPEQFFDHTSKHTMVYTVFANTLFYRIYKDQNGDTFTITHLYLVNPLPLVNDTDKSPIPEQYIEALLLGALYRAEQLRDNFDFAQIYQNKQDEILTNMKLRYGPGNLSAQNVARLPFGQGACDGRY